MKKILVLVMSLMMLFIFSSIALGADSSLNKQELQDRLEDIVSKHNIQKDSLEIIDVEDVPGGVQPIVCNTWEEVEKALIKTLESQSANIDKNNNNEMQASGQKTKKFDSISVTLYANITTSGSTKLFSSINALNSYVSLPGQTWEQTSYTTSMTDGRRTVEGTVYGILRMYMITPLGEILLSTESQQRDFYFYATEF